jgi:hypothetical protein
MPTAFAEVMDTPAQDPAYRPTHPLKPGALREAVHGVNACLPALPGGTLPGRLLAAGPGFGNGLAPAVTQGVAPGHLAEPVGLDHLARSCAEALEVCANLVQNPLVDRDRSR